MCVVEDLLYHQHPRRSYHSTAPEVGYKQQADMHIPHCQHVPAYVEATVGQHVGFTLSKVGKEKCNSRFRFHRTPYDFHVRGRTRASVKRARPCDASKKAYYCAVHSTKQVTPSPNVLAGLAGRSCFLACARVVGRRRHDHTRWLAGRTG